MTKKLTRLTVEVRRVGTMEAGPTRRIVDAYAVVVDGRERQPYLPKRAAEREAREVRAGAVRDVKNEIDQVRKNAHRF